MRGCGICAEQRSASSASRRILMPRRRLELAGCEQQPSSRKSTTSKNSTRLAFFVLVQPLANSQFGSLAAKKGRCQRRSDATHVQKTSPSSCRDRRAGLRSTAAARAAAASRERDVVKRDSAERLMVGTGRPASNGRIVRPAAAALRCSATAWRAAPAAALPSFSTARRASPAAARRGGGPDLEDLRRAGRSRALALLPGRSVPGQTRWLYGRWVPDIHLLAHPHRQHRLHRRVPDVLTRAGPR